MKKTILLTGFIILFLLSAFASCNAQDDMQHAKNTVSFFGDGDKRFLLERVKMNGGDTMYKLSIFNLSFSQHAYAFFSDTTLAIFYRGLLIATSLKHDSAYIGVGDKESVMKILFTKRSPEVVFKNIRFRFHDLDFRVFLLQLENETRIYYKN
jgi:hypothetical protein